MQWRRLAQTLHMHFKKIELEPVMFNTRLHAPKLARKCEIKHWYACGADKRKVGRSVYHHVIAKFSRMDRFSKLWGLCSKYRTEPVIKYNISGKLQKNM